MSDEEDDIILSELDDEELVQQMFDDLYDGLKEEIEEGVNILLERKWQPYNILRFYLNCNRCSLTGTNIQSRMFLN